MKKLFICIFLFFIIVTACSNKNDTIIENMPHTKSAEILYEEYVDNGKIFFNNDETGLRLVFYSTQTGQWSQSSNIEISPKDGFSWSMDNNPLIPIVIFGGIITNHKILKVTVKQKTLEKNAKIIESGEGFRLWFTTFDTLEKANLGESDPLKIEAYDNDGNILWKDGVYDSNQFKDSAIE